MNNTVSSENYDPGIVRDLGKLEERLKMQQIRRGQLLDLQPEQNEQVAKPEERTTPVERQMFGTDQATRRVSWKSNLFGAVTIGLGHFGLGDEDKLDHDTMVVPIGLNGERPETITFEVKHELTAGVRIYRSQMGPVVDCTSRKEAGLSLPLNWVRGDRFAMPETVKGQRDMDLVFLDTVGVGDGRKGIFVVLEVSLSTRRGELYLGFQRVYSGQVVSTTAANAQKFGLHTVQIENRLYSVVPLMAEDAYPGNNFFGNFKHLAEGVVRAAAEHEAYVPLSRCVVAEWSPVKKVLPGNLIADGWIGANAEWFNGTIGFGFVHLDDGRAAMAHFKAMEDDTGRPLWKKWLYPVLTPQARLAVKIEQEPGRPNPKAVRIRVL